MKSSIYHSGCHLTAEQVYDATTRCPICHSKSPRRAACRLQERPLILLLQCDVCKAASASKLPYPQVLSDLYASYYGMRDVKTTFGNHDRMTRHLLSNLDAEQFGAGVRILDFGGGDGTLSRSLGRSLLVHSDKVSVEVVLVDFVDVPDFKEERLTFHRLTRLDEVSGQFDIVLASAILEHIPEVHDVIKGLFDRIVPGGWFYARTPYILPFIRLFRKTAFNYPIHVHDMGDRFWNRVVNVFSLDAKIVVSQPSIVESAFGEYPLRMLASHLLKFPARVEQICAGPVATCCGPG